jgi:hypothetical protein
MATNPAGEFENKVHLEPDAEKAEETQNEYKPDKAGSGPLVDNDAHIKAVTRSLLFKLDTRYAPLY